VTLSDDGNRAVVANRGDGSITVIDVLEQKATATIPLDGVLPYGVVMDDNRTAYVSLQGSNQIVVVDITTGQITARIAVPPAPAGLAVWGDFLYVTHFWSGQVTLVYLPQKRAVNTIATGLDTGLSQAIELDITRGLAYLPQTRSNAQNTSLTFDTVVFPVVNVLSLGGLTLERQSRITLDTADRPVNMPFAAALDRFRSFLYVANAGSNSVSVIDLNTGLARASIEVGSNPRGLLLNKDNTTLFVHNVLDSTLSIVDTRQLARTDTLVISDAKIPVDRIIAQQLFYTAVDKRVSHNSWMSCANCHFDGMADGRVWQGFPDGPRRTPPLYRLLETAPYTWSGRWDELADAELKIRQLQAGTGLIEAAELSPAQGELHAGLSVDLDSLVAYLSTLEGPPTPKRFDAATVKRGEGVFTQRGCAKCHVGTAATDLQTHDVGTGSSPLEKQGKAFDTPSLRWLWMGGPYFHDGSAATLRDVFSVPGAHQLIQTVAPKDIDALIAYLLSLPS
jgi:YVTN family beta-propeller protein